MKISRFPKLAALVLLTAAVLGACDDDDENPMEPETEPTIAEIAADSPDFETLVAAVEAADLTATLNAEGPFTVFAPTDAAFDALPPGTVDALLQPENRQQLIDILTYHVVADDLLAADVVAASSIATVQGQSLTVTVDGQTVRVDDAAIIQTNIPASNGVIHVIDAVLQPE